MIKAPAAETAAIISADLIIVGLKEMEFKNSRNLGLTDGSKSLPKSNSSQGSSWGFVERGFSNLANLVFSSCTSLSRFWLTKATFMLSSGREKETVWFSSQNLTKTCFSINHDEPIFSAF